MTEHTGGIGQNTSLGNTHDVHVCGTNDGRVGAENQYDIKGESDSLLIFRWKHLSANNLSFCCSHFTFSQSSYFIRGTERRWQYRKRLSGRCWSKLRIHRSRQQDKHQLKNVCIWHPCVLFVPVNASFWFLFVSDSLCLSPSQETSSQQMDNSSRHVLSLIIEMP